LNAGYDEQGKDEDIHILMVSDLHGGSIGLEI